jgi:hypothetical protein
MGLLAAFSVTAALFGLFGGPDADKPYLSDLQVALQGHRVEVSFVLVNGFTDELFERIQAGLAEGFRYDFALSRDHKSWFDNKINATSLEVVAKFNAVTHEYLVNYRQDGKLIESKVVRERIELERVMTRFSRVPLFSLEDVKSDRRLVVKARADLGSKTILLLIPKTVSTDWVQSRKFRVDSG